jgi:hypothetical protein
MSEVSTPTAGADSDSSVPASAPTPTVPVDETTTLSKIWTDGVFIMLATGVAYTVSYFYELGFAEVYNIPHEMIVLFVPLGVIKCSDRKAEKRR